MNARMVAAIVSFFSIVLFLALSGCRDPPGVG
jgi:hypothetical protein